MNNQKPFAVSLKEACLLAGVQKDAIYAAVNSGELSSLKIGRRRLFRPESIHAWILQKEQAVQPPPEENLTEKTKERLHRLKGRIR